VKIGRDIITTTTTTKQESRQFGQSATKKAGKLTIWTIGNDKIVNVLVTVFVQDLGLASFRVNFVIFELHIFYLNKNIF
jgi:hypothetical protein